MPDFTTEPFSTVPFLLLPVRVQTKFRENSLEEIAQAASVNITRHPFELLVRIYPDQISIHRHEEPLTASEIEAAQQYWRQALLAPDRARGQAHSLLAWQTLLTKYGAPRGYWILQRTLPTNLEDLITRRDAGETDLPFDFPYNEPLLSWDQPARAICLPDRFVVSLYQKYSLPSLVEDPYIRQQLLDNAQSQNPGKDGLNFDDVVDLTTEFLYLAKEAIGEPVQEDLPVGLNPRTMADDLGSEVPAQVGLGGELAWLSDFDTAVSKGMALTIKLTGDEFNNGFKRLVVLGVREGRTPDDESVQLRRLLQGHYFTDGLALVPQGTPTNNTGGDGSGYSSAEQLEAESTFRTYLGQPLFQREAANARRAHRDGQRIADALGLEPTDFEHVAFADATDGLEAMLLNRTLWPATFGYYLRERLQPLLGSSAAIEQTRTFFEEYVTGRGPVPAIRIGNEPYGVLPTTQYSQWQAAQSMGVFGDKLWEVIRRLDTTWTERLNQALPYPPRRFEVPYPVGAPYRQDFLSVLGQEAASVEFYQRYWVGPNVMDTLAERANALNQDPTNPAQPSIGVWPQIDTGGITPPRTNIPARYGTPDAPALARTAQPFNPLFQEFVAYFDPANKMGLNSSNWPRMFDSNFQSGYRKVVHTYANEAVPVPGVTGPIVDPAPLSETNLIQPFTSTGTRRNFLHWLSDRTFDEIRVEDFSMEFPGGVLPADFTPPNSLLYRLMRHAVLLRYWEAAVVTLEQPPGVKVPEIEAEFFNILTPDKARWEWLYYTAPFLNGAKLYKYLQNGEGPAGPLLVEYLQGVAKLADVPTARLERLLAEHLDLGNYRIDAWKIAQVTTRLVENRGTVPTGTYLGAFGWLEDVKLQDQSQATGPEGLRDDPDNLGYIHAPTINHGIASAVLRQGFKSRQFETAPLDPAANRMAVNLSSERVRRSLAILEGIRTGGSLAAILGREFEEGLFQADPSYGKQIEQFRQRFPFSSEKVLVGQAPTGPAPSEDQQAARQVVNGLALAQAPRASAYPPYGVTVTAGSTSAFLGAVQQQVDKLRDTLDALGDLTVGESIYQAVLGNMEQAGAMLENVAKGKFPPSPEIVHPPRAGVALTHRVLAHLPQADPPQLGAWPALTPLARAEPGINRWLATLLPPPGAIVFDYSYTPGSPLPPPAGTPPLPRQQLSLAQAGVQPIDLLHLLDGDPFQTGSSLDLHLAYRIRSAEASDAAKTGMVRIDYLHAGLRPLLEILPLLARLRQLLGASRSAVPTDLMGPSFSDPGQVSGTESPVADEDLARVDEVVTALKDLRTTLTTQLAALSTPPSAPQQAALRATLHELGAYALPQAHAAGAPDNPDLAAAGQAVLTELARRLAAAGSPTGESPHARYTEKAKALLGPSFCIALRFSLPAEAATVYKAAVGRTSQLLRAHLPTNPLIMDEWLQSLAPVREPLDHLEKVMLLHELLLEEQDDYVPLVLVPTQLSTPREVAANEEYWLGMSYPSSYTPPTDAVSLVQLLPPDHVVSEDQLLLSPQLALWLDEWNEVIPHEQEDTAVVFHYDQPNTEPPQTLLLAVAPRRDQNVAWKWENLLGAVNETLDLAKKRTIEPGSLAMTHLGTLLPGLVAPVAQEGVTMTLDFRRINGSAQFAENKLAPRP